MQRARSVDRSRGNLISFVFWTFALAIALTAFYYVHEQLPRFVRAPSALILAPVAIVDGLCHAAHVPGIYGKPLPIFVVNCVFAAVLLGVAKFAQKAWRRRNV
ncbi:MAG: hypothetical protein M3N48_06535 [Verrucomicrobiota bacterium]|nr:hypothetical protein [Verrucomicrobiota bacterium]